MNFTFDRSKTMIRNNDHGYSARQASALQHIHDSFDITVQQSHRGKAGVAHWPIFVIRVVPGEKMKEKKIRFVFLKYLDGGIGPDFVLPRLTAVLERAELLGRNRSIGNQFPLNRAIRIG